MKVCPYKIDVDRGAKCDLRNRRCGYPPGVICDDGWRAMELKEEEDADEEYRE